MTKTLIIVAIVVAVALGAWQGFEYWERVQDQKEADARTAATTAINPQSLPGMSPAYDNSLQIAQQQGATGLGNWLKAYGPAIQDPRKAWIQLDYVLLITRENPQEAKRIFNEVKDRTPPTSPVWPRVHELEKSYQ
jgi:hypothetical protein